MANGDEKAATVFGVVMVFLLGVVGGLGLFAAFNEHFSEREAVGGVASGVFKHGGHFYAYDVVIDSVRSDSLNNWRK